MISSHSLARHHKYHKSRQTPWGAVRRVEPLNSRMDVGEAGVSRAERARRGGERPCERLTALSHGHRGGAERGLRGPPHRTKTPNPAPTRLRSLHGGAGRSEPERAGAGRSGPLRPAPQRGGRCLLFWLYSAAMLALFRCYSPAIPLLFSCYSPDILLLFSCYSPAILLLFSCHSPAILLLFWLYSGFILLCPYVLYAGLYAVRNARCRQRRECVGWCTSLGGGAALQRIREGAEV